MEPIVRLARIEEADALTALCIRSKRSNGYDAAFMAACVTELTITPARIKAGGLWVVSGDVLCGCAGLTIPAGADTGEIGTFFIDPEWQGQGVGTALWAVLLDHARKSGLRGLHLDADPSAEVFYRRLGFETVGRVASGSIPGRTLPRMEMWFAHPPNGIL